MADVVNFTIGSVALLVMGLCLYVTLWCWWVRPLGWALNNRQWDWAALVALTGPLGGFVYRRTQTINLRAYAMRGDIIVRDDHMYRVLRSHGWGSVLALHLGQRRTTVRA
jgi:hypothetical protein